jgi:hypothetical protein
MRIQSAGHNARFELIDDWLCRAKGFSQQAARRINYSTYFAADFVVRVF